ncbi:MAG: T9SS type A sorting domain-containing protein [Saprospiraceae bacterium]|nr:T9SS type A sorting domain-containing protein [Saprospiraceae bacterium]
MKATILTLIFCFTSLIVFSQCFQDRHNTSIDQAWVTCTKMESPNDLRGTSHWILYDLKTVQQLGKTHFWNINSPDQTDKGLREAIIDYSVDNTIWNEWGRFTLSEGTASGFYEGEPGPDLTGISARYILITIVETHGNTCAGFGEVRIESFGETSSVEENFLSFADLNVSPNPAIDFTNLSIEVSKAQSVNVQITNLQGKVVSDFDKNLISGKNEFQIPLNGFANGQYQISIDNGRDRKSAQLTIINL